MNLQTIQAEIRALRLQIAERRSLGQSPLAEQPDFSPQLRPSAPPQAANQLRNGDASHSVRTWFESSATDDDMHKECAWWFAHDAPSASQQLYENTTRSGGSPNNSIKYQAHSAYSALTHDWHREKGYVRLTGTKSLDQPFPQNLATASRTEHIVFIAARRHRYIHLPSTCRFFAGVWDNTSGQRNWLTANNAFTVSGSVVGSPAGTVERRYRVYATTDRGFTFLSNELVIASAPSDASYISNSVYVALSWTPVSAALSYEVYRYTPSTGVYVKLRPVVTSGAVTLNDQNQALETVGGYPAATDTFEKAYTATRDGALRNLAVDGVSSSWDTIELAVKVPASYQQGATTDKQWARLGLTEAADLYITGCATDGAGNLTAPEAVFESAYSYNGLTVHVYDSAGTLLQTTTVSSRTSDTVITTSHAIAAGTNRIAHIVGAGFHGVMVDLIHSSYQSGATYSPFPEDLNRVLQGGTGTGGEVLDPGGGGVRCVWEMEEVCAVAGNGRTQKKAKDLNIGEPLSSGNIMPNYIRKIDEGWEELVIVTTENGWIKRCSKSHKFQTSIWDAEGTSLKYLKAGDYVLTETDGREEGARIKSIVYTGEKARVIKFSLSPGKYYSAGIYRPPAWKRLVNFLLGRKITGGIRAHNYKESDYDRPLLQS
jgi:hypothetical protein